MQLLPGQCSPVAAAIPADDRFGPAGIVRPTVAYDAGLAAPPPDDGAAGQAMHPLISPSAPRW